LPNTDFDAIAAEHVAVMFAVHAGATPPAIADTLGIELRVILAHIEVAGGAAWLARGHARLRR